jgi:hypothetical protein
MCVSGDANDKMESIGGSGAQCKVCEVQYIVMNGGLVFILARPTNSAPHPICDESWFGWRRAQARETRELFSCGRMICGLSLTYSLVLFVFESYFSY